MTFVPIAEIVKIALFVFFATIVLTVMVVLSAVVVWIVPPVSEDIIGGIVLAIVNMIEKLT